MSQELRKKCLLVEDDEVTAFLSMRVLKEQNAFEEILVAKSGEEALSLSEKHFFDLIILDFSLPGIDGGEFITAYSLACAQN